MSLNRARRGQEGEGRMLEECKDEQTPNYKEVRRRRNLRRWPVGLEFGMTSNQTGCQRVEGGGLNSRPLNCCDALLPSQCVCVG